MSVRLAFCILVLMGSLAFLVTAWQPFKDLKYAKVNLAENKEREDVEVRKFDGKQRELENLQHHREYREMRACDILNRSKPGEHIFRIER